ncbi:MAG: zinc-dependent peptidase [Bacteroidota bacterium]
MATITLLIIIFLWAYIRYFHIVKPDAPDDIYEVEKNVFDTYNQFYQANIPYYNNLDSLSKAKFVERSIDISKHIQIQTRDELVYDGEMNMFICGCLAQLTYGLNSPNLDMLKGVVLFPDIFYSRLVESDVKGLALGNGVVFLSWHHFKEGYKDSRDTFNLGLHEFAHILRMEALDDDVADSRFSNYYEEWNELASLSFHKMRNGSISFFRDYAATNESEFFSVCIENFFEVPDLFEQELPSLYYHLCYLLNQNPLNTSHNYSFNRDDIQMINEELKRDIPVFEHVFSTYEKQFWQYGSHVTLMALIAAVLISVNILNAQIMRGLLIDFFIISSIILCVRYWYFSDIRAITNTGYVTHLVTRVMPLLAVITFVFHLLFI